MKRWFNLSKYWLICIVASVVWSVILAEALDFMGMPTKPINFAVSVALFTLFIPAFFFCSHNIKRVQSLIVCAVVSMSGLFCFFISDNIQFNQLVYSIAWLGAFGLCWFWLKQRLVAIMALILSTFGVLMVSVIGAEIPPGQYDLWVVARNALWVALVTAPIAQTWIEDDAPAEAQTSRGQSAGGYKQAA